MYRTVNTKFWAEVITGAQMTMVQHWKQLSRILEAQNNGCPVAMMAEDVKMVSSAVLEAVAKCQSWLKRVLICGRGQLLGRGSWAQYKEENARSREYPRTPYALASLTFFLSFFLSFFKKKKGFHFPLVEVSIFTLLLSVCAFLSL